MTQAFIGQRRSVIPHLRDHLTAGITKATLRVQQRLLSAVRERLTTQGFTEILPPIIGPVTDPGIRGSKQVEIDFYGNRYRLMTSAILYKQASLLAFDRVFCIAPNVRLEPLETAQTSRHLAEFHQIDVEMAGATREDAMHVAEDVVRTAVQSALLSSSVDLDAVGRDRRSLIRVHEDFDRLTHTEVIDRLVSTGHTQDPNAEIDWPNERIISSQAERPFFIIDYPKGSRGFYDQEDTTRPGVLRNFDLIAAEGFGELASGGQRENDYAKIVTRMRETGENPKKYAWYLELARAGIPPSSGFGIGLERLVRYIAGLDEVWQASAFPKVPGVVSP